MKLGCDAMLSGFSRIYHCSLPGRASMSLDLSAVEKALRTLAPASAMSSFRPVSTSLQLAYECNLIVNYVAAPGHPNHAEPIAAVLA